MDDRRIFYNEEEASRPDFLPLLLKNHPVLFTKAFLLGLEKYSANLVDDIYYTKDGAQKESVLTELIETDHAVVSQLVADGIRVLLPSAGNGLKLMESDHLMSLGIRGENGLYATRDFEKGEIITYYYGRVIKFVPAAKLSPEKQTHARTLFYQKYTILGNEMMPAKEGDVPISISIPATQLAGLGLAAMANDGVHGVEESKQNSNFEQFDLNYRALTNPNPFAKLIVLVATRKIISGEEILNSYGEDYWERRKKKNTQKAEDFIEPKTVFPLDFISSSRLVKKSNLLGQKPKKRVVNVTITPEPPKNLVENKNALEPQKKFPEPEKPSEPVVHPELPLEFEKKEELEPIPSILEEELPKKPKKDTMKKTWPLRNTKERKRIAKKKSDKETS